MEEGSKLIPARKMDGPDTPKVGEQTGSEFQDADADEQTGRESQDRNIRTTNMAVDKDFHNVDGRTQLLKYELVNRELTAKLAAKGVENDALRAANQSLTRQLEEMKSRLVTIGACESGTDEQVAKGVFFATACEQVERSEEAYVPGNLDVDTANFLLTALQDSPVYVSYSDRDLRYVWCNRSLKGFSLKDLLGKRDDELAAGGTVGYMEFFELKKKAVLRKETQVAQVNVSLSEGECICLIVTSHPHFDCDGLLVGISSAAIDVTEQMMVHKATEEELRQAVHNTEEAICAKNMFLAIMSHEIRTPLNGLLGLAEALDATSLNAEQQELVNVMMSSGVIIADILSDILDLASMEAGGSMQLEEQLFSPAEVVQDILKMAIAATREKGIAVLSDVATNVPPKIIGDPLRVRQVMKYLVLNAIKFTNDGSVNIRVGVTRANTGALESSSSRPEERPIFRSTDYVTKRKAISDVDDQGDSGHLNLSESSTSSIYRRLPYKNDLQVSSREFSTEQKRTHFTASDSEERVEESIRGRNSNLLNKPPVVRQDSVPAAEQSHRFQEFNEATPMVGVDEAVVGHDRESNGTGCQHLYHDADQLLLCCEIVDTGVGIPEEAFPTLFDKFTQVNTGPTRVYGGTGLGLAICKQLVELMGGQLTVASKVGMGSVFTFTVLCKTPQMCEEKLGEEKNMLSPVKDPDRHLSTNPEQLFSPLQSNAIGNPLQTKTAVSNVELGESLGIKNQGKIKPRILLAEDNKVNVMVAISMLKRLGFTAQVVANGVEALEAIRKDHYDLVLLDICMPLMDGLQVAYAIRQYEETGEWPEDKLRDIFASASKSLLRSENDKENRDEGTSKGKKELMKDALEGLRKTRLGVRRLPIVAVTANALRSDVDKYFAHGMDAFIAKPVMFQKLREILAQYFPVQVLPPQEPVEVTRVTSYNSEL